MSVKSHLNLQAANKIRGYADFADYADCLQSQMA